MNTGAPERIYLPRKDSTFVPNAEFYAAKYNDDDIEYILASAHDKEVARTRAAERKRAEAIYRREPAGNEVGIKFVRDLWGDDNANQEGDK